VVVPPPEEVPPEPTANPGDILQYVPLIAAGITVWKAIDDKRSRIVLRFNSLFARQHSYYDWNTAIEDPAYCIRVGNKSNKGRPESCEGWISVEKTKIDHPTIWIENREGYTDISLASELVLFRVSEVNNGRKEIAFINSGIKHAGLQEIRANYKEYLHKVLTVKIGSANAHAPKSFRKDISLIVQDALK
jgi:hypothetical protein